MLEHMYVYTRIGIHIYMCVCVCVYAYIHIYAYIYIYIHAHTYIHTYRIENLCYVQQTTIKSQLHSKSVNVSSKTLTRSYTLHTYIHTYIHIYLQNRESMLRAADHDKVSASLKERERQFKETNEELYQAKQRLSELERRIQHMLEEQELHKHTKQSLSLSLSALETRTQLLQEENQGLRQAANKVNVLEKMLSESQDETVRMRREVSSMQNEYEMSSSSRVKNEVTDRQTDRRADMESVLGALHRDEDGCKAELKACKVELNEVLGKLRAAEGREKHIMEQVVCVCVCMYIYVCTFMCSYACKTGPNKVLGKLHAAESREKHIMEQVMCVYVYVYVHVFLCVKTELNGVLGKLHASESREKHIMELVVCVCVHVCAFM